MSATFFVGDAIEVMSKLPEKSVDLILTSPPFLALRSYLPSDHPDKHLEGGSQATPGMFIDWLIDVVEACDRVLAPHGSLCIELGDTYAGSGGAGGDYNADGLREGQPKFRQAGARGGGAGHMEHRKQDDQFYTLQPGGRGWPLAKSLSLIPELFRLTLVYGTNPLTGRTTDRWRLRNVVRWVRPNPPVGALGDKFRPATSELMVFCKSAKRYFDLDAVRSEAQGQPNFPSNGPKSIEREALGIDGQGRYAQRIDSNPAGAPPLDWWNIPLLEGEEETRYGPKERDRSKETPRVTEKGANNSVRLKGTNKPEEADKRIIQNPNGAPPLDWWNIPPGGYEGAHYAVFPPELCIKPIKAMCPERVCKVCGEPSRRISEAGSTERIARLIRDGRDALGLDREALVPLFIGHYKNAESVKAQVSNWELGKNMPSVRDWAILKEHLSIGDDWDHLLPDRESVTYAHISDHPSGNTQNSKGDVYQRLPARKNRIPPDRFSDCGCPETFEGGAQVKIPPEVNGEVPQQPQQPPSTSKWRPGLVLDPFGGSGTTALVATGHGRDAILIDLDARNYDLALQRVGPFILERGAL